MYVKKKEIKFCRLMIKSFWILAGKYSLRFSSNNSQLLSNLLIKPQKLCNHDPFQSIAFNGKTNHKFPLKSQNEKLQNKKYKAEKIIKTKTKYLKRKTIGCTFTFNPYIVRITFIFIIEISLIWTASTTITATIAIPAWGQMVPILTSTAICCISISSCCTRWTVVIVTAAGIETSPETNRKFIFQNGKPKNIIDNQENVHRNWEKLIIECKHFFYDYVYVERYFK